jgi:hypothetical protein
MGGGGGASNILEVCVSFCGKKEFPNAEVGRERERERERRDHEGGSSNNSTHTHGDGAKI